MYMYKGPYEYVDTEDNRRNIKKLTGYHVVKNKACIQTTLIMKWEIVRTPVRESGGSNLLDTGQRSYKELKEIVIDREPFNRPLKKNSIYN